MDDISFGTAGWRAPREEFTVERLHAVAQGVTDVLAADGHSGVTVAVGYDAREGAPDQAKELARVLAVNGHDVIFADRDCPTPALAQAVRERGCAGGLMVTASHNPPEYSGVKFIPETGAPATPAVTERIEAALRAPDPAPDDAHGTIRHVDLLDSHIGAVLERLDPDLAGLTIAYDGMYGSGRGVTDEVLEQAGATVRRVRCDRDQTFGGKSPNPTPDRLGEITERVSSGDADLGIANDGDADRVAVVTESGVLDANRLFAILYDFLLETDAGDAVRTVSTTSLIDRIARAHGQAVHETAVGFKYVAETMLEQDALMGGEESGGFTIRGHLPTKDGVLTGTLAAMAHTVVPLDDRLTAIVEEHGDIHQDRVSVDCPDEQKAGVVTAVAESPPDTVDGMAVDSVDDTDGIKLVLEDGSWLLVRPSGTEPKIRIYAEGPSSVVVDSRLTAGKELIRAQMEWVS